MHGIGGVCLSTRMAAGSPSGSWALPFSSLHFGLRNLLTGQRPQSAGWLTPSHSFHTLKLCRSSRQSLGLAKSDFSLGMSQTVRLGDLRMESTFCWCQWVCSYAAAVSLPAVCARQQHKSRVVGNNQVTNDWKTKRSRPSLQPGFLWADVLIVPNLEEKSFQDADRKVRLFPPRNGLQCVFWMDRAEIIWHRAQNSRFLWLRNVTYSNNLILHLRIAKREQREVKCSRFRVKRLVLAEVE